MNSQQETGFARVATCRTLPGLHKTPQGESTGRTAMIGTYRGHKTPTRGVSTGSPVATCDM